MTARRKQDTYVCRRCGHSRDMHQKKYDNNVRDMACRVISLVTGKKCGCPSFTRRTDGETVR